MIETKNGLMLSARDEKAMALFPNLKKVPVTEFIRNTPHLDIVLNVIEKDREALPLLQSEEICP